MGGWGVERLGVVLEERALRGRGGWEIHPCCGAWEGRSLLVVHAMLSRAVSCSTSSSERTAAKAAYLRMTASGYGNWGKEVLRMSADIEDVLTQGGYFIKMLYSYRSCGKAIPLGGVADRVEEKQTFNETLFALLRAEVVKMVDLMKYCAVLVDFVCTSIEVYNTFRQAHRLFPPDVLVGIVEVFDLVIKLDALKDVKVCLKNDFAFYKRALHGMKASLSEAKELEEEVYRLQMFLSNPVHSKGYLASTLRDRLNQVRGGHEAALVRVVEQCLHEVDEKKQKHTRGGETPAERERVCVCV